MSETPHRMTEAEQRRQREAAALRANLARRKQQQRQRAAGEDAVDAPATETTEE